MKFKYFIPVLATAMLVACGGKTSESKAPEASSKAPSTQESAKPSSAQGSQAPSSRPSSAPASNPSSAPASNPSSTPSSAPSSQSTELAMNVSSVDVEVRSGKTYVKVTGTSQNANANNFKWAFAIEKLTENNSNFSTDKWIGNETPVDADYKVVPTLAANGDFTVELCLSDIEEVGEGFYRLHGGPKGLFSTLGTNTNTKLVRGDTYSYEVRVDNSVGTATLAIVKLPPMIIDDVSVYKAEDNKLWAKIGGDIRKAGSVTAEVIATWNPYINFQQVGGRWTNTRRNGEGQYKFEIEGSKLYLHVDIDFFAVNNNYNTHLNVFNNTAGNCKTDVSINRTFTYNGKEIQIYSNLDANTNDQNEFWGNLGWRVTAAAADATEGEQIEAHKVTFDALEHAQLEVYMDDMYETRQAGTGNVYYTTAEGQYSKVYDLDEDVGAGLPFKVICDAGYGVKNIEITPATVDSQKTYKNIKTPENTKVENGYKITWVYTDIQVKVNVVSASELLPGRKVTFNVPSGAQLTVYKDKNFTVVDPTADYYLTRDSDGVADAEGALPYSTGAKAAIYFKVLVPAGKAFTVTVTPAGSYNKSEAGTVDGTWKVTKILDDINIAIAIVDAPAA